jgi:glucose-1-phosphatase
MKYPTLIFDLGNVLIFVDHRRICRKLSDRYGLNEDFIYKTLFMERLHGAFEEGKQTPVEFTRVCASALHVDLELEDFRGIWSDIFVENHPVIDLVRELRENGFRLILLSNTDPWHIQHIREDFKVLELFEHLILSYEAGCAKPDRRIYERLIRLAGGPSGLLYIDDIAEYITAAGTLGVEGLHFTGENELRMGLRKRGIL